MMAKRRWRSGHRLELMIRQVLFIFASVIAVCSSGCQWLRWATPNVEAPPGVFNQSASKEEIIQRVNANSQAIRSLQAKIHVRATGTPTLSGDLTIEQPSRLRLQAGLLNMNNSGIDLGSNDNEFWVWLKTPMPGQQPECYTLDMTNMRSVPQKKCCLLNRPGSLIQWAWLILIQELNTAGRLCGQRDHLKFDLDTNRHLAPC